jgi:hypothetical protein
MTTSHVQVHVQQAPNPDPRALKILAKSIYKELRTQGYDAKQVVGLATELISQVTSELEKDPSSR